MNRRLEGTLLFRSLVLHLLRGLIGHSLFHLLELLRELEELTALINVDDYALRW